MIYILPSLFIFIISYALIKKVNVYSAFCVGIKNAAKLMYDIFPYIIAIMLSISLFRASGLTDTLSNFVEPVFSLFGIPSELCEFIILRPFTGSGSLALLTDLVKTYGADSYISKVACVIMGSSETVFYVSALYLSNIKDKKTSSAILLALLISFVSVILSCFVCHFF